MTNAHPVGPPAKRDSGRAEIVEAAARCFMHKGFDKTTIDDIAHELNATKGRVYHRFRAKNEIFFAVYRQAMQFCFDAVDPIIGLSLPAREKLLRMAEAHAMVMMEHLPYQRSIKQGVEIYLTGATTEAERRVLAELVGMRDRYEERFRKTLRDGELDGTLGAPDVAISGRAILAALNGLTDWYRPRSHETQADRQMIARKLAFTVVDGVACRPYTA
ncbi:TetR/AcrR family transcriptional regulator [Roseovarius sp. TE539]|uniref:TetR/AcrR family transcriptional regulator n=1 Tax=Roseovarius sp. TE539 TaxID=2249812 RepID=UPI00215B858F|nr:TetR/AcrR family transcriptional regulator [Roseovarius sp. TE539]